MLRYRTPGKEIIKFCQVMIDEMIKLEIEFAYNTKQVQVNFDIHHAFSILTYSL